MARYYGEVGYGEPVQVRPGVWEDQITERSYRGEVKQNSRLVSIGDSIIGETRFQTTISILAGAEAFENEKYTAIRYIKWAGSVWTVTSVKVDRPRLILMLGEVYHGPTATP